MERKEKIIDAVITVVFMLLSFWIGLAMANNAPDYKAHVKDGVVTVVPIN